MSKLALAIQSIVYIAWVGFCISTMVVGAAEASLFIATLAPLGPGGLFWLLLLSCLIGGGLFLAFWGWALTRLTQMLFPHMVQLTREALPTIEDSDELFLSGFWLFVIIAVMSVTVIATIYAAHAVKLSHPASTLGAIAGVSLWAAFFTGLMILAVRYIHWMDANIQRHREKLEAGRRERMEQQG